MFKILTPDTQKLILYRLNNLSLVAFACSCHYWNHFIRVLLNRDGYIPLELNPASIIDIHYGPRRFPKNTECPCYICIRIRAAAEALPEKIIHITSHISGPYDPMWTKYVRGKDQHLIKYCDAENIPAAVMVKPKLKIPAEFMKWMTLHLAPENISPERYAPLHNIGILPKGSKFPQMSCPGDTFSIFPPFLGSILIYSNQNRSLFYCIDTKSPYYNNLILRNGSSTVYAKPYSSREHLGFLWNSIKHITHPMQTGATDYTSIFGTHCFELEMKLLFDNYFS